MPEADAKATGVCPVCGKRRRLTKAGTLWNHGQRGVFPLSQCPGRGRQPRPDYLTVTEAKQRLGVGAASKTREEAGNG